MTGASMHKLILLIQGKVQSNINLTYKLKKGGGNINNRVHLFDNY